MSFFSDYLTMIKKLLLFISPLALLLGGCSEYNYLQSPFTSNSNPYHAIPLQSDSISGATYISTSFTAGSANIDLKDYLLGFRAAVHRANTFGNFHLYYGTNISVGTYHMSPDDYNYQYISDPSFRTGNKFFGGVGFNGGFNVLVPLRNGGEWRVVGLEGSAHNEFGEYLAFRRKIPDSLGVNYKYPWMGAVGITTEIIARRRSGTKIGYKLAMGLGTTSLHDNYSYSNYTPVYVSNTLHFGKDNWVTFFQLNFGSYTVNFQFGVNFMIGASKKE